MTPEIKTRLAQIQRGEVPEGYKKTNAGIIPKRWSCDQVSECLQIRNQDRKPISEEVRNSIPGPYPYYGPTKAQGYINTYSSEGQAVLIGEDGDHFLKYKEKPMTMLIDGKYTVNNHAHMIVGTEVCKTEWFFYAYQFKSLLRAITRQGAGRYKLTKEALMQLAIQYPCVDEQDSIIEILSTQDRIIRLKKQLITQKRRQKQYLMQQLLTGKKRLPGFDEKWQRIRLKDYLVMLNELTSENDQYEVLSVTKSGITKQSEHFRKQIASANNIGYKIVRRGNLVFSTMNLWMGSLDVLEDYDIGIVSPAYKVFEIDTSVVNETYCKYFMKSDAMIWRYKINSEQGASVVRRNLDLDSLLSTSVSLPNLKEQTAIGEVLSTADREIALLEQDLEQEKQKKKALMQLLLTGIVRV